MGTQRPWRILLQVIDSIRDAIPPYNTIEGSLLEKETGPNDTGYIWIGNERVEVDPETLKTLKRGENLRVRCTRKRKAITIERFSPGAS